MSINESAMHKTFEAFSYSYLRSIALIVLIAGISACSTVKIGTSDFIVSDSDLAAKKAKVPTKELNPLRERIGSLTFEVQDFKTKDGMVIRGIVRRHPEAQATVLLYGNNAFRVAQQGHLLINALASIPVNVVQFDYRGYGLSEGVPTAELIKSDALLIYDQVKTMFPGKIVIHGHSFGSFVASYIALNRQPDALVLEGTSTSANDFIRGMTPWYAKPFVRFEIEPALMEYDNQRLLQEYKKPLLIMVGNNDTVTPPAYARALFESVPEGSKQYREIPSADHMNVIQQSDTKIAYAEFITQLKRVK